jgi:hypothetical protein
MVFFSYNEGYGYGCRKVSIFFSILGSFLIVGGDGHWAVRARVQDFIF